MREREEKEEYEDSSIYLNSNNHRIENERDSWSPQEVDQHKANHIDFGQKYLTKEYDYEDSTDEQEGTR